MQTVNATVKATVKIKVKVADIMKQAAAYIRQGMSMAGALEKAARAIA